MEYRIFDKSGEKISLLGFGTMRLPVIGGDPKQVDFEQVISMIRRSIDGGVNYVDTAYVYHGGNSERAVGMALRDGYREKVFIADKMTVTSVKEPDDVKTIFEEQLQRLETDVIDFYLLHNVNSRSWSRFLQLGIIPFLEEKKAEGKIRYLGFSYHDEFEFFKQVVNYRSWDFCQLQFNYMDTQIQAGLKGLHYAKEKGLQVIVMEPLKGGKLTTKVPENVLKIFEEAPVKGTPAEWAMRYVADQPEVLTILSGMSNMEQVEDNLRILAEAKPRNLSNEERKIIADAADEYRKLFKAPCTECHYCMPCPHGVHISLVMRYYNDWFSFGKSPQTLSEYGLRVPAGKRAADCIACDTCIEKCPQKLPISDIMAEAKEIFK